MKKKVLELGNLIFKRTRISLNSSSIMLKWMLIMFRKRLMLKVLRLICLIIVLSSC